MREIILLPFGEQKTIDKLLTQLGDLVDQGREQEFAIILPTSQLLHHYRHKLVRSASRQINLLTFDEIVAKTLKQAGITIRGLDNQTRNEVVAQIMGQLDLPYLGKYSGSKSMAGALAHVFGQLRRAKISPRDLENQVDPLLNDVAKLWHGYREYQQQNNLADLEEQYILARELVPQMDWVMNLKQVHIAWFFDFEPLQMDIIQGVAWAGPSTTLYLPFASPGHNDLLLSTINRLQEIGFSLTEKKGPTGNYLVDNLFGDPPEKKETANVKGFAAPRLKQELELVAREIKGLASQGARPGDVCLVVPDQHKYLPLMRRLYREQGIDLSMPMVTDLIKVPWVSELLAIWRGVAAGWDRDSLLAVAGNAYITQHLPGTYDGDALEWAVHGLPGNLRGNQWLERLDKEIISLNRQLEDTPDWMAPGLKQNLELLQLARPSLEAWLEFSKFQKEPQDHLELINRLMESNIHRIFPSGTEEEDVRDRAAYNRLNSALKGYLDCCRLLERTDKIGPSQFLEDLSPWLEMDLSLERSSPGAIRVLMPSQVRGITCDYMFILGLNQGVFPRPPKEHWLLDRIAQLPGLEGVGSDSTLEQEKIFFHSCVSGATKGLYLSRQLPGSEGEAEVSGFWREVDDLLDQGIPVTQVEGSELVPPLDPESIISPRHLKERVVFDHAQGSVTKTHSLALSWLTSQDQYTHWIFGSRVEQRREGQGAPDNMDGILGNDSKPVLKNRFGKGKYSISRLEQYLKCPFGFMARYLLDIAVPPHQKRDYSPMERGNLLHWLLEQFYRQYLDQADPENPETITGPLNNLVDSWQRERELDSVIWKLRLKDAVSQVSALIMADLAWLRKTGLKPLLHEATFGMSDSEVDNVGQGGVCYRGKIDRIDILEKGNESWAVVYDYKTSSGVTRKEITEGRSLQIPVYLLAAKEILSHLGHDNVKLVGGTYYAISKAKLDGGIWHQDFAKLAGCRTPLDDQDFDELLKNLQGISQTVHGNILEGIFPPGPVESRICEYCDFVTLCRYDKNRFKLKSGGEVDEA